MRPWLRLACLLVASVLAVQARAFAGPKLVVVLVVDQMRADYVDWYGKTWKGGLERLFTEGAVFRNAAYPYLNTVTCAGHATVGTGTYPHRHGMIQNAWYDRKTGAIVSCTDDPASPLVAYEGAAAGGDSGVRLLVPTLADEMRAQLSPAGRVVTLSLKARSAIMLAGHRADATTWMGTGGFVTSKAFAPEPVRAVVQVLAQNPIKVEALPPWTRALPASAYAHADEVEEEAPPRGWARTFPHALAASDKAEALGNWARSPHADAHVVQLALGLVKAMNLGKGLGVDYLGVSFSVLDLVGHAFGPRSHEVQDVLARLDVSLGRLLAGLDAHVGRNNYVLALTSDHGVAPFPEQMSAMGLPAGRIPMVELRDKLEQAVGRELGGQHHVASVQYTDLYLAPGSYEKLLAKPGAIERVQAAVQQVPGVAAVYHAQQLAAPPPEADSVRRAAALSFFPGRSGDLVIVPAAHWMTVGGGTTHGTSNDYDQRVPLVFAGPGIKAGQHFRRVSPADLAPTLAQMLGVTLPNPDGRPLPEVLPAGAPRRLGR